jgi:hypothetical protein
MTLIGYTMMCEQPGPRQLVRDVGLAEEAGFDFASSAITSSRGSVKVFGSVVITGAISGATNDLSDGGSRSLTWPATTALPVCRDRRLRVGSTSQARPRRSAPTRPRRLG